MHHYRSALAKVDKLPDSLTQATERRGTQEFPFRSSGPLWVDIVEKVGEAAETAPTLGFHFAEGANWESRFLMLARAGTHFYNWRSASDAADFFNNIGHKPTWFEARMMSALGKFSDPIA